MTYSGAQPARTARENLGRALAALQEDSNIPPDVMAVAQNIAQAVGALFDAERSHSEPDGKASVKAALSMIGQTLALLQDVKGQHKGIQQATESIAQSMSLLYPLTNAPSMRPQPSAAASTAPLMGMPSPALADATMQSPPPSMTAPVILNAPQAQPSQAWSAGPGMQPGQMTAPLNAMPGGMASPQAPPAAVPSHASSNAAPVSRAPGAYRDTSKPREDVEVNIGANTESNFYVGFSGEIAEGGVFSATYSILERGTPVRALVTLPGGFETHVNGYVRFVRDPMDMNTESDPGMGIQFEGLDAEQRELILRFVKKRRPIFFDD
jgi:uncharacterized protein (TIGR02266 family)